MQIILSTIFYLDIVTLKLTLSFNYSSRANKEDYTLHLKSLLSYNYLVEFVRFVMEV